VPILYYFNAEAIDLGLWALFYDEIRVIRSGVGNCCLAALLPFAKVLRKSKLSEPPTRRRSFCNNAFTTTKTKSYFIKLVNKTIKEVLLYNFRYIAA
jgi:hypothetical protein